MLDIAIPPREAALSEENDPALAAQHTLAAPVHGSGVGLHSGVRVGVTLRPAPADTGLVFRVPGADGTVHRLPALWHQVTDTRLNTRLGDPAQASLATVEHLVSALAGLGVDNAVIEVTGPETPVMDGSARPFVAMIDSVGLATQAAPRRPIRVLRPVTVRDGDRWARLLPATDDALTVDFGFDWQGRMPHHRMRLTVTPDAYRAQVAAARTFGRLEDAERLRAAGLARGASLENTVVVGGEGVINPGGLRCPDEFVRHKVLDAVGDLALAGAPLVARFEAEGAGHTLNNQVLHALFADTANWTQAPLPPLQRRRA